MILAGKGHETYQVFADRTIHFDERKLYVIYRRSMAIIPPNGFEAQNEKLLNLEMI